MKKIYIILLLALTLKLPAFSKDETDYQARFLLHKQQTLTENKLGLAAWAVIPDFTVEKDQLKTLIVAGPMMKLQTGFLEVMGGALLHDSSEPDKLINIRWLHNMFNRRLSLFTDAEYFFTNERFYLWLGLTTPFVIANIKCDIGLESENIFWPEDSNSDDIIGIGPRLCIHMPFYPKAVFISALEFRNNDLPDFFRNYFMINF